VKHRAFTLIELLVALSLLTLVAGALFFSFGSYLRNWRQLVRQVNKLQVQNLVAERITTELRLAAELVAPLTTEEVRLKIGGETIAYAYQAGKVRRQKGGAVAYLTSEGEISALAFSYPASRAVTVQLDDISWVVTLQ
jgi:prepilin-type N-terminal cleavage/methylation domain-containing protein